MCFMTIDAAWQLGKDKRDRYLADATRARRRRPQSPIEPTPDPGRRAA
jgi:hypothetical protein